MDTSRASGSDPIAFVTAGIAVLCWCMRASALCCATSKPHSWGGETRLPRHHPLESEAWAPIPTLALNLWYSSCFAKKHIDTTRSKAKALASSAATNTSAVVLVHPSPKLANLTNVGKTSQVVFGLTAHGEQLNLVTGGLAAQQLVIKLVHDRNLHLRIGRAEGLTCTSCRPKRFLIKVFGTTHKANCGGVRNHPKTCVIKRKKAYKWQCDVRSVSVVVVAIDLPEIPSRVAKQDRRLEGVVVQKEPLFSRLVLLRCCSGL